MKLGKLEWNKVIRECKKKAVLTAVPGSEWVVGYGEDARHLNMTLFKRYIHSLSAELDPDLFPSRVQNNKHLLQPMPPNPRPINAFPLQWTQLLILLNPPFHNLGLLTRKLILRIPFSLERPARVPKLWLQSIVNGHLDLRSQRRNSTPSPYFYPTLLSLG